MQKDRNKWLIKNPWKFVIKRDFECLQTQVTLVNMKLLLYLPLIEKRLLANQCLMGWLSWWSLSHRVYLVRFI